MPSEWVFEVIAVDEQLGNLVVKWNGRDDRCMTCRIPVGAEGILAPEPFAEAILSACRSQIDHWRRLDEGQMTAAAQYVGQSFDVTDAYVLGSLGTQEPSYGS